MAGRRSSGFGVGLFHLADSDMVGEGLGGECSMAEDDSLVALERDHRGFDAVIGWAGVDDQVDPVTEFLDDVCRRGRADTPEPVGARRSDGHAGCRDRARATGCAGHRTPTVGPPLVIASGTISVLGSTIVRGPGQNAAASRVATVEARLR